MEPASIRTMNPGAMWGHKGAKPTTFFATSAGPSGVETNAPIPLKWGSTQTIYLSDGLGQDNNIAIFPTWVQGICAQLDLWRTSPNYKNKRFADAIHTWSGGNEVASYIAFCKQRVPGLTEDTIMNDAFWQSLSGVAFLKAQAWHEAGKQYPAPDADWIEAQRSVMGASPAQAPVPSPPLSSSGVNQMTISQLVSPVRVLKFGDGGPAVVAAQLAMKQMGYQLSGTGWFGPATDVAVRAVQRRAGLKPVDGEIGPATAKALDDAVAHKSGAQPLPDTHTATSSEEEVAQPLWLQAGLALINVHEAPGATDNPEIIDWAKEEGGEIAKEYTHDSVPWCALFANHCLTKAGLPGTETLWALDFAGHWPSVKLIGPAVGAFAPMTRAGGGHIIQIVGKDSLGNIMGLGGNQSDAVNIMAFPMSRLNQGFWWPKSVPIPKKIGLVSLPVVTAQGKLSTKEN
jgi:uncharacterized protein (TIGR02594 family)